VTGFKSFLLARPAIVAGWAIAAVSGFALATPAHAALKLSANVGGTFFTCTDQAACDTNATVGILGIGTTSAPETINGVDVFGSVSRQIDTTGLDTLSSSSLQVINNSGAARNILVAVGATDFSGGPTGTWESTGSGTFLTASGSSIDLGYFVDSANAQGADTENDTPGVEVDTFLFNVPDNAESFQHDNSGGPVATNTLYSMTLQFGFDLPNGGNLSSRGMALIVDSPVPIEVPEPASLILFGAGLIGIGALSRRRRRA
jgi:hypothetical protein